MSNSKKSGFTLVEVSIVLVIVGLLIGGILAAISIRETSRVQAQVRQIGQIDASVMGFVTKYGNLPGDATSFEVVAGGTQDNLIIETSAADQFDSEAAAVWPQLSASGFKREEGGSYVTGFAVGTAYPKAVIGSSGNGILAYGNEDPEALNVGAIGNVYIIADCSEMIDAMLDCKSGLSGNQVISIDQKMDDGVGTSGNVAAVALAANSADWGDMIDGTEASIPAGSNEDAAILVVRIGATHGSVK